MIRISEQHNSATVKPAAADPGPDARFADLRLFGSRQLEAHVDELMAVCEQAEKHYFPATRAASRPPDRIVASDSTHPA